MRETKRESDTCTPASVLSLALPVFVLSQGNVKTLNAVGVGRRKKVNQVPSVSFFMCTKV